jgi:signal transduction histidine kinase
MGLRGVLALLFVALLIPSVVLILHTRDQLKWEAFHQYRTLADELGRRIDADFQRMLAAEEARGYADYGFVVIAGDPSTSKLLQRSPLARYPVQSMLPGLIGYFQIDAAGVFSTPLLPDDLNDPTRWGLDTPEIRQRVALRDDLVEVLERNQLLEPQPALADTRMLASINGPVASPMQNSSATPPSKVAVSAAAFDTLNAPAQQVQRARNALGRVDELPLAQNFQRFQAIELDAAPPATQNLLQRSKRIEQSAVVEPPDVPNGSADAQQVSIFQSEVDPFEFSLLDDEHSVLYRKVWRNGQRTIQGAIIDQTTLLDETIVKAFKATALAQMSDMAVAYQHDVVRFAHGTSSRSDTDRALELQGELLHQTRLSAPLGDFSLLWNINRLPNGPGTRLIFWASLILLGVLLFGFVLLYRLGMKQILLVRQQQDFVSAVSHELSTPLTSIRMYAEMLEAGWPSEEKKRTYYRFIHDESQRLSRLIANVLQLARMERKEFSLELKRLSVDAIFDMLRSKVSQQIEHAGFNCRYDLPTDCGTRELLVDADAFAQIVINLVDNALKFSARAELKLIEISAQMRGVHQLTIAVRDHGPGIEPTQLSKIFTLFYRPGGELTRETIGTGIGLALVRLLARAMGGEVEAINRTPGAEFQIVLPALPQSQPADSDVNRP